MNTPGERRMLRRRGFRLDDATMEAIAVSTQQCAPGWDSQPASLPGRARRPSATAQAEIAGATARGGLLRTVVSSAVGFGYALRGSLAVVAAPALTMRPASHL